MVLDYIKGAGGSVPGGAGSSWQSQQHWNRFEVRIFMRVLFPLTRELSCA